MPLTREAKRFFKVSRIGDESEASRAGGPVTVGLCRDSAPINSTP